MIVVKTPGKRGFVLVPDLRIFVKADVPDRQEYRWVKPGDFEGTEPVFNQADGIYIPVKF